MIVSKKIIETYDKYVPKNITLNQFKEMVDKDPNLLRAIGGDFSTVNPEISVATKNWRKGKISDDDLRDKLKDSIDAQALEQRVQEYAKMYEKIICSNKDILEGVWLFDKLTEEQREEFACKIIEGINKYLGIGEQLNIVYLNKDSDEQDHKEKISIIKRFLKIFKKKKTKQGSLVRGRFISKENKLIFYKQYSFLDFLETLSHEYGHFIDREYPDLGGLGTQIAFFGSWVYNNDSEKAYLANPSEISSFKLQDVIVNHIEKVLLDQGRKDLPFYKAKLSGLKLKLDKIYDKLFKAKMDVLKQRGLYDKPRAKIEVLLKELNQDQSCTNIQKLLKKHEPIYSEYDRIWYIVFSIEWMLKKADERQGNVSGGNER